jgi:hypothetical protein
MLSEHVREQLLDCPGIRQGSGAELHMLAFRRALECKRVHAQNALRNCTQGVTIGRSLRAGGIAKLLSLTVDNIGGAKLSGFCAYCAERRFEILAPT